MEIALAQLQPIKGDISFNTENHLSLIRRAVDEAKPDAIFFPELSLTGYEPSLAHQLRIEVEDSRLQVFQEYSDKYQLAIVVGAPTTLGADTQISSIIFQPNSERIKYAKQFLHEDEKPYFIEGEKQEIIEVQGFKIAPAICYESLQAQHLDYALQQGAEVYVASVAHQKGVEKAYAYFSSAAKKHSITIFMVNCIGPCDSFTAAGQSAVWGKTGALQANMMRDTEGFLVYEMY